MQQDFVRSLQGCVAAVLIVLASTCNAGAFTLNDDYSGGYSTYGSKTGDTIEDPGTHNFEISSAVITRSGPGYDTLNITINTNFAGVPGTGPADGTGYGSLFLTKGTWNPNATEPGYTSDQYTPNEWQYAVTIPQVPNTNSGTSGLYAIGTVTNTNNYGPNNSVVQSYTTQYGTVVMSNVNGDPVTYPGGANPNYYFRQGQAVQYDPTTSAVPGTSATWSVDAALHTITYSIVDNVLFGNSFALAWAMTCANDVIQGQVFLSHTNQGDFTPIPAAVLLMGSVLGAGGFIGRWRQRRRGLTHAGGYRACGLICAVDIIVRVTARWPSFFHHLCNVGEWRVSAF